MGWEHNVALMRYGEGWFYRRKIAHQNFRKEAVKNYHNVLLEKVHSMLDGLLNSPEQFDQHNRMCAIFSFP
jgi:cytochrome P450